MIHRCQRAFVPQAASGLPYTAYSLSDFAYVAQGLVELTDKTDSDVDTPSNPRLAPNGQWVAWQDNFPSDRASFEGAIRVIPAAAVAGSPAPIRVDGVFSGPGDVDGYALHPSWHPDNDHIVYVRGRNGFQGHILVCQRSNPEVDTAVYTNPDYSGSTGWGVYRPQYNRAGTKIAFLRAKNAGPADGNDGLWVMDADGSNLAQIDDFGGGLGGYGFDGSQFQWGPGDIIVYHNGTFSGSTGEINMINADGTGKTLLSTDADTSVNRCRVTNRCFAVGDGFILGTAQTSKSFVNSWDLWRWELDGSGGTWLDLGIHGPGAAQFFRCAYVHVDGRVYMVESPGGGRIISCLPDGTDVQTPIDLGTNMDGDQFYTGTGIEWL